MRQFSGGISQVYEMGKVDVSDLNWEQKEGVLRYQFARMNHHPVLRTLANSVDTD